MNRNDVIKGLRACARYKPEIACNCPYHGKAGCFRLLIIDANEAVSQMRTEIKKLKKYESIVLNSDDIVEVPYNSHWGDGI